MDEPESRSLVGEVDIPYYSAEEFGELALAWLTEGVRLLAGDISDEILARPPLKPYWHSGVMHEEDPRFYIQEPPLWGDVSILYPPRNKHYAKPYSKTSLKRLEALAPTLVDAEVSLRKETDGQERSCALHVVRIGEEAGFARLLVWIDPETGGRLDAGPPELRLLRDFAERFRVVFGHVSRGSHSAETELEQALILRPRRTIPEWDQRLRGYSWVTIVPRVLADRVGGPAGLRASGAFADVTEMPHDAVWLQATQTWDEYAGDQSAIERVFEALAPVLPAGKPHTKDIIRPGAPGMPELSIPYLVSARDAAEFRGGK